MTDTELDPRWNERPPARKRREAAERNAQTDTTDLGGAPTFAEARQLDLAMSLAREALMAGLDPEDLQGLLTDPSSDQYAAVAEKILNAPQVSKRATGLATMLDKKLAALVAANEAGVDPEAPDAPDDDAETDAAADDEDPGLALLTLIAGTDTEEDQVELLTQLVGDADTAASLLNDLAEAESEEDQLALLASATAGEHAVASDDEPDDDETATLRQENELLKLAATNPAGVKAMQALIGAGTLEEQVLALQALLDGRPVPQVDRNNAPRPLRSGLQSALSADGMSDEVADALLGTAGKGALVSSRRAGY